MNRAPIPPDTVDLVEVVRNMVRGLLSKELTEIDSIVKPMLGI